MTLRAYYVNGYYEDQDSPEHAIYFSDRDELTGIWSDRAPINIEGQIDGNAVDPNLVQLEDGRYLLTYMRGQFTKTNPESVSTIYSAWSYDGINFFDPIVIYKPAGQSEFGIPAVTDPSLVQLNDGSWLLAISSPINQAAELYTSEDGVNFAANGVTLPAFSPDFQLLSNGSVRIVYADAAAGGFGSQVSSDGGATWVMESGARFPGPYFDASVFQLADGTWGMFYKTQITVEGHQSSPLLGHLTSLAISSNGTTFTTLDSEFASAASVAEGIDFSGLTVTESFTTAAASNDQITLGNQGAHVRAGGGIDVVTFSISSSELNLEQDFFNQGDWVGHMASDSNVAYLLQDVERLTFSDKNYALDLDGSAGLTVKTLAAVIGKAGLSNKEYVGIGLQLFDAGQSLADVCELALGAVGATTNEEVVNLLYTNLYGEAPTTEQAQPFVDLLDDGIFTKGSLAAAAAELTDDLGVIDLVGLAETGIEYV